MEGVSVSSRTVNLVRGLKEVSGVVLCVCLPKSFRNTEMAIAASFVFWVLPGHLNFIVRVVNGRYISFGFL